MLSIPNWEKINKIKRKETISQAQYLMMTKNKKIVIPSTKLSAKPNSWIPTGVRRTSSETAPVLTPKIIILMLLMMQRTVIVRIKTRIKTYPM